MPIASVVMANSKKKKKDRIDRNQVEKTVYMTKIEIPLNKKKISLILLGSIGFVTLGLLFTLTPDTFISTRSPNESITRIIGIITLTFFGIATVYGISKLFDKSAGLIINDNGIIDNTNFASVGLIKWEDIKKIKSDKLASSDFMLIYVKNPKAYLEKATFIKRKLMQGNMKMYGTPLSLTSLSIKCDYKYLATLIDEKFSEYKQVTQKREKQSEFKKPNKNN